MSRREREGHGLSRRKAAKRNTAREAFRFMRSNLIVAVDTLENPCVIVTSANEGEGKTSTCVGIAQSLAAAGNRVVLADFDLRSPDSHRLLGAHNRCGVSDLLLGTHSLEACLQDVAFVDSDGERASFEFVAAGPHVASPTELFASLRAGELLGRLADRSDVVLIDAPPVLPVADTLVIGRWVGGALLVVEASQTTLPAVSHAREALTRNDIAIVGVVLNKFEAKNAAQAYGAGSGALGYGSVGAELPRSPVDERRRARA